MMILSNCSLKPASVVLWLLVEVAIDSLILCQKQPLHDKTF